MSAWQWQERLSRPRAGCSLPGCGSETGTEPATLSHRSFLFRPLAGGRALAPLKFPDDTVDALVAATGSQDGRDYGFTFSDLVQRLLPAIALEAYPDGPIRPDDALAVAQRLLPTPPFREDSL